MYKNNNETIIKVIMIFACVFSISILVFSILNNKVAIKSKNIEVQNKSDNESDISNIQLPSVKEEINEDIKNNKYSSKDDFVGNWEEPEMGRFGVKISKKGNDYFVNYYGSSSATDYREIILKCFLDKKQNELICNGGTEIQHYATCNGYNPNKESEWENYFNCEQQNGVIKEKTEKIKDERTWIISITKGNVLTDLESQDTRNYYDEYQDVCLNMINDTEDIKCFVYKKKE